MGCSTCVFGFIVTNLFCLLVTLAFRESIRNVNPICNLCVRQHVVMDHYLYQITTNNMYILLRGCTYMPLFQNAYLNVN